MKIFKGLALFAALEASTCPDQWTQNGLECHPSGDWSATCNKDGTMTIVANIKHFYENVPSSIKSDLISGLTKNDGWAAVGGEPDQLTQKVPLTYGMLLYGTTNYITGKYTVAPSATAASAAQVSVGDISLDLAVPLSFVAECRWESEIKVDIADSVGISTSTATYDQGSASVGSLDVSLKISGADASTKKWMLGDEVKIEVDYTLDNAIDVQVAIEKCTAYSDSDHTKNAVTITHGTCGASPINAVATDYKDFVSSVTFDAFKYNADSNGSLDAVAYVSCDLRVCLTTESGGNQVPDSACAAAVSTNELDAEKNNDVTCVQ